MMSHWSYAVLAVIGALLVVSANEASQQAEVSFDGGVAPKASDISADKRQFFVGSRYGRSSQQYFDTKARRVNVAPRNDRFFLGSRYGKRSNEFIPAGFEQESANPLNQFTMACRYTGFKDYFRCNSVRDLSSYFVQPSSEENDNN